MARKSGFRLYLSYSKKDRELINPLIKDLEKNKISVFFDENIIEDGKNWQNQLTSALAEANGIIVLITQNSVNSQYVMNELGMARSLSQDQNNPKLLLPIVFGEVEIPLFIQDIHVIFWRDNYNDVISRIVKAVNSFVNKGYESAYNQKNSKEKDSSATTTTETATTTIPPEINKTTKTINPNKTESTDKNNVTPGYWLLKLKPETWKIDQLKVGEKTFFSPYYFEARRPEFSLLEKIQTGDKILCYASGEFRSLVCEMFVTNPYSSDDNQGAVIRMEVSRLITPKIPLDKFRNLILNLIQKLEKSSEPPELFFQLNEIIYNEILSLKTETDEGERHIYQPFYLTEGDHESTTDQLEFQNDINSFASVIALKKVKPPLAIGLFGNWGSGKSFFMEKLSEQIGNLTSSNNEDYVKDVVQVKFNSWHYSDANLWASLITEIFDSLKNYAKGQNKEPEIIKLQRTLKTTILERKVIDDKRKELEKSVKNLEIEQAQKRRRLEDASGIKLLKQFLTDKRIKSDLAELSNDNIEEVLENKLKIEQYIRELQSNWNRIVFFFKEFSNLSGWRWVILILTALLVFLAVPLFKYFLPVFWEQITLQFRLYTTAAVVFVANTISVIKPWWTTIRDALNRLQSLKSTMESREQVENPQLTKQQSDVNELQLSLTYLDKKITETKENINEIISGRQLIKFIEEKSKDESYNSALGVISRVRKDFVTLDKLLREQHTLTDQQRNELVNPEGVQLKIDRIILYIDDLDRCDEEVVVRVLEAIHLILAFPLFVVVVGVDPRWLNNALSEKYKYLFGLVGKNNPKEDELKTANVNQLEVKNPLFTNVATSYDYLEKIFQIPFALKPINKTGRENLIQYLIRDEMQTTEQGKTIDADLSDTQNAAYSVDTEVGSVNEQEKKISTQLEEDKVLKEKREKEKLVFSTDELNYMQKISFLFGKTPRSINRYVNIYRIIKAHDSLDDKRKFDEDVFKPIMFLLGVIVGYSLYAKDFIDQIAKADDSKKFSTFLKDIKIEDSFKTDLMSFADEINDLLMLDFKRNLELISRFSFRILLRDA